MSFTLLLLLETPSWTKHYYEDKAAKREIGCMQDQAKRINLV